MRNCSILCTVTIVFVCLSSSVGAQDNGIFSGQGVRFPESSQPVESKSKWPKLLDFSKDESAAPKSHLFSSMFSKQTKPARPGFETSEVEKPKFDWFRKKPDEIDHSGQAKPLGGFADLFPKRDPNRPGLLGQMNTKSKDWIDRTTGWTERMTQKKRERSASTWDAITKDWRAIQSEADHEAIPAQPPVRSAEAINKPRVRF